MEALPKTWFDKGIALEVIRYCFQQGQQKIRIASGFFTIKGWGTIRQYTMGKRVDILVGLDEPGSERARKALIGELLRDLQTGLDRDRRSTVADLVARIEVGEFRLVDARATDHHAKIYLVDCQVAIIGSSNTTRKGLVEQIESGNIVTDIEQVNTLVEKFDRYFAEAQDLTQELLEALKRWLELASPWDIYLKTMLALEDLQEIRSNYPKHPVSYQVDAIAQTLRQLRQHQGSMLVASTGLGKTIVAVHVALRLYEAGEIDNIMVVGPKAVRSNWKREMRAAGLPCEYFVRQALDKTSAKQDSSLSDFEDIVASIQQLHQRWLVIFDESHELRNRYKPGFGNQKYWEFQREERLAFKRLRQLHHGNSVYVLLLTGSPYAKEIDNLNHQLFLLPHTADNRALFDEPDYAERTWQTDNPDNFINLDVVSQLTTPHVAKYYGQHDGEAIYINFEEEKRYIPQLILHSIEIPLPLERELSSALVEGYFKLNASNPVYRETIQRQVRVAWASSILALRAVLERIVDTPGGKNAYKFGKLEFIFSRSERQQKLAPLISELKKIDFSQDIKLVVLAKILKEIKQQNEKIIIFCERRATVVYLKQALQQLIPSLQVAVTIEQIDSHSYQMKETHEIENLIKNFAPISNEGLLEIEENYDVFISTDAHGVGVNMQDASVVINYDIDWTPIGPIQRAGRILRFWHSPRTVKLYTFVPTLTPQNQLRDNLIKVMLRWNNLLERHGESRKLIDLAVLTAEEEQILNLPELASQITIKQGELDLEDLADTEISPYFKHTAKLQENRDYARQISGDIISAKTHPGSDRLIYVLLKYKNKYYGVVCDLETQKIDEPNEVKLLNLIECDPDTPIAAVEKNLIEEFSHVCIQTWCSQREINAEEVVRECTLYLKPEREADTIKSLLESA